MNPFNPITARICLGTLLIAAAMSGASSAAILEDFTFDDPNGTVLGAAANTGTNAGNLWVEDVTDMSNSSVLNGSYRIQKDNDNFGTNYLQIDNIASGQAWLVAEIAGWSFSSIAGPGEFDTGELEEFRFGFINSDTGTSGSDNTAQVELQRTSSGGIELVGNQSSPNGGSSIVGSAALNTVQNDPFTIVLELNKDTEQYSVFYKDGSNPFQQLGTANVDPVRDGNSVRMVVNNNFSGTGEFFDLDRFYLTDESPLVEAVEALKLQVNTTTGAMTIANDTSIDFDINSYRISSTTDDLNFAGWNSLSDQVIDAVDGVDPDSVVGNGIGETWDEAGGSDDGVLAESFLQGSSLFSSGRSESLGTSFKVGGDTDSLNFQYRVASNGALFDGEIEIITGGLAADADNDGDVDGADFLILQRTNRGLIAQWQTEYGTGAGPLAAAQTVPEPTALLLFTLSGLLTACGRRARGTQGERAFQARPPRAYR
ncbi:MAG: hypothetical protein AAGD11_18005 [Planctomycetota bacterium]